MSDASQASKQSTAQTSRTMTTDHVEVPSEAAKRVRLYANRREITYKEAYLELISKFVDDDGYLKEEKI